MKTNFSMLFYVKKQKNYASGVAPIYLRITVDGKHSEITANRECNPGGSAIKLLTGTTDEILANLPYWLIKPMSLQGFSGKNRSNFEIT